MDLDNGKKLVNQSDFVSMGLHIYLQQYSKSDKDVLNSSKFNKAYFKGDSEIVLVTFEDTLVTLSVPLRDCSLGHRMVLRMELTGSSLAATFTALARVSAVENMSEKRDQANLVLEEFDKDGWEQFKDAFAVRQDEINQFFTDARGEE